MSIMESEIQCRYAKAEDREAVLNIIPNIYDGNDPVVTTFLYYLQHPAKLTFVGEQQGKVVAFLQHSLVDDGKTIVPEAGRIVEELRHTGVMRSLGLYAIKETLKQFPKAQQVCWTSLNTEVTNKVVSSHGSLAKIVAKRHLIESEVKTKALRAFFASEKFSRLYKALGCESTQVQTPDGARQILQNSATMELFPDDLLFCFLVAFAPLPSNYQEITKRSATVTTQDPGTRELLAVSFATEYFTKKGCLMIVSIYSCNPLSISLTMKHILKHMILLNQYISSRSFKTTVTFQLPKNTNVDMASSCLINDLGFVKDSRVREVYYVRRSLVDILQNVE